MCQLEMVGEEGAFVVGWDEVLTEEELSVTLKVSNTTWLPGGQSYARNSTDTAAA